MSNSVVVALIGFGRTLEDSSVEAKTKLHVLGTLNEVTLTLSELSESGVGRSVNKLKNAPGELGSTARLLVCKWKRLLHAHMAKESMPFPMEKEPSNLVPETVSASDSSVRSGKHHRETVNAKRRQLSSDSLQTPINSSHSRSLNVPKSDERGACAQTIPPITSSHPASGTHSSPSATVSPEKTNKTKPDRKHKLPDIPDSIDSTSGLSFMESLSVGSSTRPSRRKKAKHSGTNLIKSTGNLTSDITPQPTVAFTNEILSSLTEDFDRPDILCKPFKPAAPISASEFEDGDLKFKSKTVLWVPKTSRSGPSGSKGSHTGHPDDSPGQSELTSSPSSLVDLCLDVVEHNLGRLDHVGDVPYELLVRALRHASSGDLARIERCNPQFVGCSDDLWQKHVRMTFQGLHNAHPSPNESWCAFYQRLSHEEANRLNRIINQSARKIREEQESRRTTLTTEVITPRQIQRRLARQVTSQPTMHNRSTENKSGKTSSTSFTFKPYNVSQPSDGPPVTRNPSNGTQRDTSCNGVTSGGGLLNKLRKQFRCGRLR